MPIAPGLSPRLSPADIVQAVFNTASGAAVKTTLGGFWIIAGTTASLAAAASESINVERANDDGKQRRFRILSVAVGSAGKNCKVDVLHRLLPASSLTVRHRDDYDGSQATDHLKLCDPHDIHVNNGAVRITHDAGDATAYQYVIVGEDLQTIGMYGDDS